jgi:hypothetical protein
MNRLALTCTAAFEALGAREIRVLSEENTRLSAALFNACMPSFLEVVRRFNDAEGGPQCNCDSCRYLMLVREAWCAEPQHTCKLWLAWDDLLARLGVSVDPGSDEFARRVCALMPKCAGFKSDNEILQMQVDRYGPQDVENRDSPAAVVKMHDKWVSRMQVVGSWGRPVASMQDPRIAEWQRLFQAIEQMEWG